MNTRRSKWIKKLVEDVDPQMLLTVRRHYGEKTNEMDPYDLYKSAKTLWKKGVEGTKLWGKN